VVSSVLLFERSTGFLLFRLAKHNVARVTLTGARESSSHAWSFSVQGPPSVTSSAPFTPPGGISSPYNFAPPFLPVAGHP
jgi:hypothetical protein